MSLLEHPPLTGLPLSGGAKMFGPAHDLTIGGRIPGDNSAICFSRGMIFLGRSTVSGRGYLPYVQPCTVTDEEISERSLLGEFEFDVIDEHASTIWFTDQAGFRQAYSLAREVVAGKTFDDRFRARDIHEFSVGKDGSRLIASLSAHHIHGVVA